MKTPSTLIFAGMILAIAADAVAHSGRGINTQGIATQRLLIPQIVELPEEDVNHLLTQQELLKSFGLHLEAFGLAPLPFTKHQRCLVRLMARHSYAIWSTI